jgi:diguanylate cyclase
MKPQTPLPQQPIPTLEQYRRQRTVADLYRRALSGPPFYALALALTQLTGGHFVANAVLISALMATLGVLGYLRWAHKPPEPGATDTENQRWWMTHWWLIHVTCLVWCACFIVVGFQEREATTAFLVATVATITFTSVSGETYSLSRVNALVTVVLMQGAALLAFAVSLPALHGVAIVLFFFMVYQALHIRRRADEYDKQIHTEYTLITSRAEIDRLSRQDVLTGLSNRREYEAAFDSQWQLAQRQQGKLSLMVLDLDNFKRINDTHGHSAGDSCLKHVAEVLRQRVRRSSDMVARIGGEEFVVLLPDTSNDEAMQLAQTVRNDIANAPVTFHGKTIQVTTSIGVGAMEWDLDLTPQASFSRVDAACYVAKAQGRNRVVQA